MGVCERGIHLSGGIYTFDRDSLLTPQLKVALSFQQSKITTDHQFRQNTFKPSKIAIFSWTLWICWGGGGGQSLI